MGDAAGARIGSCQVRVLLFANAFTMQFALRQIREHERLLAEAKEEGDEDVKEIEVPKIEQPTPSDETKHLQDYLQLLRRGEDAAAERRARAGGYLDDINDVSLRASMNH